MSAPNRDATPVALDAAIEDIRAMTLRGAARIGRTAAACLAGVADSHDDAGLKDALHDAGQRLIAARPTAISLRNAVNLTLDGLQEASPPALRAGVTQRAQAYAIASSAAAATIADSLAQRMTTGATILTHCHSSLAVAAIVAAHNAHKDVRVFADETRPWHQGHITVKALHEAGVHASLIVDSAAHHIMETEGVTAVVLGADTVTADGALYNKIGTRAVALGAQAVGIPVYVCAETVKFSPYSLDGELPEVEERARNEIVGGELPDSIPVRNPVFDRTPPALITLYITEHGPVRPREVGGFIRRNYPNTEDWI